MAVASYNIKPFNSKYTNWIEAFLAVQITKEGIEDCVYDEIKQFQQKCLADICNSNCIPSGSTCSCCFTENVVVCPTNRICNVGRGTCSYHLNSTKQYLPAGCPNLICHNLKKEIQNAHRYYGPSYKNTDATKWCTNPWEVAKCFMPPDGYKDVTSSADTDFNGIISVIINYKEFEAKISEDLSKKSNIFEQGRTIAKALRHSPSLEVEDSDLQQYFIDLQALLSDPKLLAGNKKAQNAQKKLSQLQNDTLIIDIKQFRQMLEDVSKSVRFDIKEEQDDLKKKSDERKYEMIKTMKDVVDTIGNTKTTSLSELNETFKSSITKIKRKTSQSVKTIKTEIEKELKSSLEKIKIDTDASCSKLSSETVSYAQKLEAESKGSLDIIEAESKLASNVIHRNVETGIERLKTETGVGVQQITSKTEESILRIEEKQADSSDKIRRDKYNKTKKALQDDLITLYRQQYHTLPFSPLFEENDIPLLGFYVMPDISKVQKSPGGRTEKSKLTTLYDVFKKENKLCRDIYLVAAAGLGKTAFSKRLVLTWCQAHKNIKIESIHFEHSEIGALSQFEFGFMLSLRVCSEECDIDEMIRKQIVPRLSNTPENIETILSNEKCLVILDGLDEWTHPASQCQLKPRDIPHRKARTDCTILTTTRPWKLSVINLKESEVDQKVELEGLNEKSRDKLKENVISHLTGGKEEQLRRQIKDFDSDVTEKGISDLNTSPLLMLYLLCLWCDKVDLGRSNCEIYCQMIGLLLKRSFEKHQDMRNTLDFYPREIPACFAINENCKCHFAFLTSLGKIAFKTLFSETSENRLVFDSSITEKCLNKEFLTLGRLTGIITQDKQTNPLSQICKTSFSHKTLQEFLAALYISTCPNQNKVLTKVLSSCNSIRDIIDLSKVFIFISGINVEIFSLISNKLIEVINTDEMTSKYRSTRGFVDGENPFEDIQDMFVSCSKEIPADNHVNIFLEDFVFDKKCKQDKYYTNLQRLAVNNTKNIKSIDIGTESRNLSVIIGDCKLSEVHCQKITCWHQCNEEEIISLLSTSVKCLYIIDIQRGDERSSLTDEQCKTFHDSSQLETIYIKESKVSHKFLNYVIKVKSIKHLTLWHVNCSDHGDTCPRFSFDLSQYSELRKLELWWTRISLCDMNEDESLLANNMRNIEHVELRSVKMSSVLLRRLVEIIEQLEHSVRVELTWCTIKPREEYVNIRDDICRSESFDVEQNEMDFNGHVFEFVTKK